MEMLRCPICFALLVEDDPARCPMCHKRLKGRWRRPVVLGADTKFTARMPTSIDLARLEREEAAENAPMPEPAMTSASAPLITSPPWVSPPEYKAPVSEPTPAAPSAVEAPRIAEAPIQHTAMFQPSQFDPEMRELLDGLYRKARAQLGDEDNT